MSHRTQITLTDEQYDRLREESTRSGLGLAELVRRAVNHSYGSASQRALMEAFDSAFGSWVERVTDGEAYVESLRRGMARRLTDE
ncbi:MAG TPA: ribbon-helix-helix protein, CopG family [Nocardioidaceae bacterium]|jgi:predicted DNA-binding protein